MKRLYIIAIACLPIYGCMSSIEAYNRGLTHELNQNYPSAKKYYIKAIKKDPHYGKAYNNLGSLFANEGYFEDAIDLYTRALICDPYNGDVYMNNLSNVYLQIAQYNFLLGDYQNAINNYTTAIERKPKNEKEVEEKIKLFGEQYIKLKDLYYNKALAKDALGISSCDDYKKACELGDNESCSLIKIKCDATY